MERTEFQNIKDNNLNNIIEDDIICNFVLIPPPSHNEEHAYPQKKKKLFQFHLYEVLGIQIQVLAHVCKFLLAFSRLSQYIKAND
jgi:hypothetical protein